MSIKKVVMAGSIVILGLGLVAADGFGQAAKNGLQTQTRAKLQTRTMFIDENGDGICDLGKGRDADGDGIPNGQDPDWKRPQDGTGYKSGAGQGKGLGQGMGAGWSNSSFRGGQGLGTGICDGTGPKGKITRKGGRG